MSVLRFLAVSLLLVTSAEAGPHDAAFKRFLDRQVVPKAIAAGVSKSVLKRELGGLTPDTSLPGLTRPGGGGAPPKVNYQAEFREPGRYFKDNRFTSLVRSGPHLARPPQSRPRPDRKTLWRAAPDHPGDLGAGIGLWQRQNPAGRAAGGCDACLYGAAAGISF